MKNQALFSLKDKSKKLKCRLLQFLFGVLRIKEQNNLISDPDTLIVSAKNVVSNVKVCQLPTQCIA